MSVFLSSEPIQPIPNQDYPETINNRVILKELETLRQRIQEPVAADYVAPVDNREALQRLAIEKDDLTVVVQSLGIGSLLAGLTPFSIGILGLLLVWKPMVRLQKISRLITLMETILAEFEGDGVEMLPLQKIPKAQPIDLFIRFPGKEFLIFAIRSHGEETAVYNSNRDAFYLRRGQKGIHKWKPDPLEELAEQEFWFRKNSRNFLGGSAKASRRPMSKVLVVWGETQLAAHQEQMYVNLDGKKFLFIRREKGGAFYVIHHTQVTEFIRAYLAHRQSQEEAA